MSKNKKNNIFKVLFILFLNLFSKKKKKKDPQEDIYPFW